MYLTDNVRYKKRKTGTMYRLRLKGTGFVYTELKMIFGFMAHSC